MKNIYLRRTLCSTLLLLTISLSACLSLSVPLYVQYYWANICLWDKFRSASNHSQCHRRRSATPHNNINHQPFSQPALPATSRHHWRLPSRPVPAVTHYCAQCVTRVNRTTAPSIMCTRGPCHCSSLDRIFLGELIWSTNRIGQNRGQHYISTDLRGQMGTESWSWSSIK